MTLEELKFDSKCLDKIKSSFYHTSFDSAKQVSLVNNTNVDVYNLEKAMEIYCKKQKIDKKCTVDALFYSGDKMVFVEFKNTEQIEKEDVWKKIYESNAIFLDLIEKKLSDIRDYSIFCLVYSPKDGQLNPSNEESYQKFAEGVCNEAKEKFPHFGLERFKKFFFQDVFVLTKDEFLKQFQIHEC